MPAWVPDPAFDLANHIQDRRADGHDLDEVVGTIFSEHLDRALPLWRIDVTETPGTGTIPFVPLHDAARSLAGATVNDAVIAAVSGGLRSWLHAHGINAHALRMKVPVSLHNEAEQAANHDSFFSLPVDLRIEDRATALRSIHHATTARKVGHDAQRWETLAASLSSHSKRLGAALERIQRSPRTFAVCVSNVPGPRNDLFVAQRPVRSVYSLAEIGQRHALRITALSAAGALNIGFCADPAVVPDLHVLAAATHDTAQQLIGAG